MAERAKGSNAPGVPVYLCMENRELAEALLKALDREPEIDYVPMPEDLRATYQYHTEADISSLQALGFKGFEDRFAEYVARYSQRYLIPGKYYQQGA